MPKLPGNLLLLTNEMWKTQPPKTAGKLLENKYPNQQFSLLRTVVIKCYVGAPEKLHKLTFYGEVFLGVVLSVSRPITALILVLLLSNFEGYLQIIPCGEALLATVAIQFGRDRHCVLF